MQAGDESYWLDFTDNRGGHPGGWMEIQSRGWWSSLLLAPRTHSSRERALAHEEDDQSENRRIDPEGGWPEMKRETPAYHVILENAGNGVWTAEIPAFRAVTEGRGEDGARAMAADLIWGYIKGAKMHGFPIPKPDAVVPKLLVKKKTRSTKPSSIHRNHRKATIKPRRKAA